MTVDLDCLLEGGGGPQTVAAESWSDADAGQAVGELLKRVSAKIPIGFAFAPDDWSSIHAAVHRIDVAREREDAGSLKTAIRNLEECVDQILKRRAEVLESVAWIQSWGV